jgi:hypothetical protein
MWYIGVTQSPFQVDVSKVGCSRSTIWRKIVLVIRRLHEINLGAVWRELNASYRRSVNDLPKLVFGWIAYRVAIQTIEPRRWLIHNGNIQSCARTLQNELPITNPKQVVRTIIPICAKGYFNYVVVSVKAKLPPEGPIIIRSIVKKMPLSNINTIHPSKSCIRNEVGEQTLVHCSNEKMCILSC